MTRALFTNVMVWTAGGSPFLGEVLVQDNRISQVARGHDALLREGCAVIDGDGAALMPGLIDGHAHLPFAQTQTTMDFALIPAEEHTLITMHNARRVLDAGFTSVLSGGSVKPRLDAIIRDEIDAGRIPGPRIMASTPELTVTGGLGDDRRMHIDVHTFCEVHDGAEDFRRAARLHCREGADIVKMCISGHQQVPGARHVGAELTPISDAEVLAVTEAVHAFGKLAAAHCRSDEAVRMALRNSVDVIYHCEYATDETLDLLEAANNRVVLAPAMAPFARTLEDADAAGTRASVRSVEVQFERVCETWTKIRKRGLRVMIGGEYGLFHVPHGTNARDLEYFVKYFGYEPEQALTCATVWGAEGMRLGDRIGRVQEGYLADLLLVDGAPWRDVRVLQYQDRLLAIMKDGRFHKPPALDAGRVQRIG